MTVSKKSLKKLQVIKISEDTFSQVNCPDGISYSFKSSFNFSKHSNDIKHRKGARSYTPKGECRVHLVESEYSSDSDRMGPSEHTDGVDVAQQADNDAASDVEIGKFAVACDSIDANKARRYLSYYSDSDDGF